MTSGRRSDRFPLPPCNPHTRLSLRCRLRNGVTPDCLGGPRVDAQHTNLLSALASGLVQSSCVDYVAYWFVHCVTFVFSMAVLWVLKCRICGVVYFDVSDVWPRFNFFDEIIK